MIVVDTNIITVLLMPNDRYNGLADDLYQKDCNWISPFLWRYELLSVLSIYFRQNIIDEVRCQFIYREALDMVTSRPIGNYKTVFELIKKSSLSSYGCEFVALAKETGLPLITEDKKILREFPEIACKMQTYAVAQ